MDRRYFGKLSAISIGLLAVNSINLTSQEGVKIYPSYIRLAENCVSADQDIRRKSLDILVNEYKDRDEFNLIIELIGDLIDESVVQNGNTRKKQISIHNIEYDIVNSFLKIDHDASKLYILKRFSRILKNSPYVISESPLLLEGIPVTGYPIVHNIISSNIFTPADLIAFVKSESFDAVEIDKKYEVIFSHILLKLSDKKNNDYKTLNIISETILENKIKEDSKRNQFLININNIFINKKYSIRFN